MVILRSLPLSLSVLWRFVVLSPILVPAALGTAYVQVAAPLLGLLLLQLLFTFVTLVGIRCALQALGLYAPPRIGRLVSAAFLWTFFEMLLYTVVWIAATAAVFVLAPGGIRAFAEVLQTPDPAAWWAYFSASGPLLAVGAGVIVVSFVLYTACCVPKAAAAWSANEGARSPGFLWGFGSGFAGLAIVVLAAGVLIGATGGFAAILRLLVAGVAALGAWQDGAAPDILPADPLGLVPAAVFEFWAYCWVFAASALAFAARHDAVEAEVQERFAPPDRGQVDIRSLRKSRE